MTHIRLALLGLLASLAACATPLAQPQQPLADIALRGGTIYDSSGGAPYVGDVVIRGDRIACVGSCPGPARQQVNARGLAVAPGFINMLSWANETLIADGRGQSDLRQGVTLEVMGEGWSMGPVNDEMRRLRLQRQQDIRYPITWTTLGEYLEMMERKGVSPN